MGGGDQRVGIAETTPNWTNLLLRPAVSGEGLALICTGLRSLAVAAAEHTCSKDRVGERRVDCEAIWTVRSAQEETTELTEHLDVLTYSTSRPPACGRMGIVRQKG
jgi:hypothetical protein